MNKSLLLSLFLTMFACKAFCMIPSIWGPPSPRGVVFGECFFAPKITGAALSNDVHHNYRHICRQKLPENRPHPPQHERNWYFVGALKGVETQSPIPSFNYVPIKESLIKFIFLKEKKVEFVSAGSSNEEFKITFQSLQQSQAFYRMIYHDVNLTKAAPNKIGMLHEISIGKDRKIGNNVEAVREIINDLWYITLKNDQGEPLHIFSQTEASITFVRRSTVNKLQLLLQAHETFYILTFSNGTQAKQFSDSLLRYVSTLCLNSLDDNPYPRVRFYNNQFTMNS